MRTRATKAWEFQAKFLIFYREVLDVDFFEGTASAYGWLGFLMADTLAVSEENEMARLQLQKYEEKKNG